MDMSFKNLVLICNNYPLTEGEFFISDELRIIAKYFDNIYVFIHDQKKSYNSHYLPTNAIIIKYPPPHTKIRIVDLLRIFSMGLLYYEIFTAVFRNRKKINALLLKVIIKDLINALHVMFELEKFIKNRNISLRETIFYSYWHDFKSLSLVFLKRKYNAARFISRAHGWDVFFERHKINYIPYKNTIIPSLDHTFSVSDAGRDAFMKYTRGKFPEKISVSRLGTINPNKPKIYKTTNGFHLCSCSSIISLKRIDLIIDLLNRIKLSNVFWTHFGSGPLLQNMKRIAEERLTNLQFSFNGLVANESIIKFYRDNYIDLFINLSISEGIPVSIMEALSAGIPVVGLNTGGMKEIVNNEIGFLYPYDTPISIISNEMERYLTESRLKQQIKRASAFAFWEKYYNAEKNYVSFYNKISTLA
ncbi:TPA: glycosyltransferase [bacterium]|nr:glycosyltransferase [bacterium]